MKGLIFVLLLAVALTSALNLKANSRRLVVNPISIEGRAPGGRITNGLEAKTGQFNFQVGLSMRMGIFTGQWCGGSLISPEWILTAAHCTDGAKSITAYLGSNKQMGGKKVKVLETIIHSGWDEETVNHDIALLRIAPVTLGSEINIVKLPALSSSDNYASYLNENVIASGWGMTDDEGGSLEDLQYAPMKVIKNYKCSMYFGPAFKSTNICAQGQTKGTSTCSGDSGGPLITESSKILVGLTSFGASMGCSLGYPEVFTRITSYRSWILEHTGV